MKFIDYPISEEIKKNLELKGFKRPTDIQFKAIPPILKGEDVLAIAQTGTGKTAAFAIPVVQKIDEQKQRTGYKGLMCLVMVPTHELVQQTTEVFNFLSENTSVKVLGIYGGVDQDPQIEFLKKGTDILIATPGRLFDLTHQGYIVLNQLKILVLDEADHMLDLGFIKDIRDLVKIVPVRRQTLFFSATIDSKIKSLAYSLVNKPIRIHVSPKNPVSRNVDHAVAFIEMDDKRAFLERIVNENPDSKILVFVRTKVRAERVKKAMERVQIHAETIHSDKQQEDRTEVLQGFKKGDVKLLVATDVTARGIDIPSVDFVINYDLPEVPANYVHRVGRTGRGTRKGKAISFCSKDEVEMLRNIEAFLDQQIHVLEIDRQTYSETIDFTLDTDYNWRKLISDHDKENARSKRKKK